MIEEIYAVIKIIFLFAIFGFIHSFFASNRVKQFFVKRFSSLIAFYRFTYIFISFVIIYFVFLLLPSSYIIIYDLPKPFDTLILIPQFLALAGAVWSLKYFSIREFIGLNQILRWRNNNYDPNDLDEELTLRIGGAYKYCRHPVYFFSIMYLIFRPEMDLSYLTFTICTFLYFYIGSFFEEKKLVKKFGEKYEKYQRAVPRIFPFKRETYKKDYLKNLLEL